MKKLALAFCLMLTTTAFGESQVRPAVPALPISLDEFTDLVRSHESYEEIPNKVLQPLKMGSRFFGQIKWLKPGQTRYSFDLSVEKAIKYSGRTDPFHIAGKFRSRLLKYDNGRSLIPKSDPIRVALTDYGLIVVDGHHHAMASLAAGAKTAPLLVVEDLRGEKFKDLMQDLSKRGLIYPVSLNGKIRMPQRFSTLENDTNRYLVSLITVRVNIDGNGKVIHIGKKGGRYPIVVKIRPKISLPFQELRVADVLRLFGIFYDAKKFGDNPPKELREEIRDILSEAREEGRRELKDVLIVSDRTENDDISIQNLINEWLDQPQGARLARQCDLPLSGGRSSGGARLAQ